MKTCKCKCLKGKCGCKHKKKFKKIHVIPILALITCFQLLAPKNIKKSLPGKAPLNIPLHVHGDVLLR